MKVSYEELEKRVEELEELQRINKLSADKYSVLFNYCPDGIAVISTVDASIVDFNDQLCNQLGFTRNELSKMRLPDLPILETEADIMIRLENIVKNGRDSFETKYRNKSGELRDVLILVQKIKVNEIDFLHHIFRDITEQKRIENSLKREKELFNKLSAQVPGVIYQYRQYPDGRNYLPFASDNLYNIFEVTPEEVKQDASKVFERIHPDDVDEVAKSIFKSFETLEIWETEFRVILPERGERWLGGLAKPEKLPDGSVQWHGYIVEITEKKEAEIELQKTKEQFALAVKGTNDGIWDWDLQSNEIYLSPRWKEILGYKDNELVNSFDTFVKLIHKDDLNKVQEYLNKYLQGETDKYEIEFRMLHKDGNIRWILAKGEAIRSSHGIPHRMAGSHSDITDRKKSEELIKRNERRFRTLFDESPDAYLIMDIENAKILKCNRTTEIMLGTIKENILNATPVQFSPEYQPDGKLSKDLAQAQISTSLKLGKNRFEWLHKKYDGTEFWVDVSISLIDYDDQKVLLTSWRDITLEKEAEQEIKKLLDEVSLANQDLAASLFQKNSLIENLEETKNKLEESNREKDKFFSIIAHDLRSPFNGFIGLTKAMVEDIEDLSLKELREFSKALHESAKNLFQLLENLLTWSSVKRGATSFKPEPCLLKESVDIAYNLQKASLENKEQKVEIDVSPDIYVYGDIQMINTIIRNLLSNANKFTRKDGLIKISAKEIGEEIEISIADSGIGMPEDLLKNLFKVGEKTSRKGTDYESSSGLGLILCKEFIEKNNGKIWVESTEHVGSTFYFTLPKYNDFE